MRLSDVMTPARSWEEAAMTPAQMHTISGGAALRSVRMPVQDMNTVEVTADNKNTAAGERNALPRRRSALRHVLERQF